MRQNLSIRFLYEQETIIFLRSFYANKKRQSYDAIPFCEHHNLTLA